MAQKQDQPTGKLTADVLKILTNSPEYMHGIKVMLKDGTWGG